MFMRLLTSAIFAGALAGLVGGILQLYFVQPVLLLAELYESGQLVHFGAEPVMISMGYAGFDLTRDLWSLAFSLLIYCGYGLMLVALMGIASDQSLISAHPTFRHGIIWGVGGFVALHLAPSFGLAPEVPGGASADLEARQVWWFATTLATSVALWLFAFAKTRKMIGLGVILLFAPHLFGPPEVTYLRGPVPPEIAALFASRMLGVGLIAWVVLGAAASHIFGRFSASE